MRKTAFPPVIDNHSCILMLGTMPGEESLRKQQYYGHKSNQFWIIIYKLFGEPLSDDYDKRVAFILSKGIALWDVLSSCEREGSLDSKIKNEQANDFSTLFSTYPNIRYILFTSKKAEEFYKRYVKCTENDRIYLTLPSPSPANAQMTLDRKLELWKVILDIINKA